MFSQRRFTDGRTDTDCECYSKRFTQQTDSTFYALYPQQNLIELHHSLPADWNTFMFLLMISGTGIADGDAVLIIHGSNESNSEGRCIAKSLYGNLSLKNSNLNGNRNRISLFTFIWWKQKAERWADTDYSSNTVVLKMKILTS